jgi:uncharacterized protein YcbK (DUF882 family)
VPIASSGRHIVSNRFIRPLTVAGFAAIFAFASAGRLENAIANGDTRALSFHHMHTGEMLTVTFKREGRYDPQALEKINWLLRDWRRDEPTRMDPQLFDLLWEIHREVDAKEPITVVSAYRSPQTNAMLRKRGRGVARFSQHMLGKAIDFYIPGVELSDLRVAGLRMERGGVGFYPTSGSPFVHMDTGGIRHWPRMTRDQLARVFPDGKTVHLPADGKPMPGYEIALAALEKRGTRPGQIVLASRGAPGPDAVETENPERPSVTGRAKTFIASLFGKADEEEEETPATPSQRRRLPAIASLTAGPPAPGSTPPPVAGLPRPTASVALAPTIPPQQTPQLAWQTGPTGVPETKPVAMASIIPLPRARPSDIDEVTASLPEAIIGRPAAQPAGPALAYAPAARPLGGAQVPTRAQRAAEPTPTTQREFALAAMAPADLMHGPMIQFVAELRHPDFNARGLIEPVRAAVRIGFGRDLAEAPHPARFAGPAIAPIAVVAFDRSATGSRLARAN